jgi:4-methyl-5(b-hydroxyethyl)-thiazole monophosphate biosynthesis
MNNKKALIILANGFEEIEAVTIIDILRRAQIEVTVAGLDAKTITASRGVILETDTKLEQIDDDFTAYILPGGGQGADNLANSQAIKEIIQAANQKKKIIAAICASPAVVLAPWGILDNKQATCYPGMEGNFDKTTSYSSQKVVTDDNIITSQGPATALLFALEITRKIAGENIAEEVKKAVLL